jgi:hypothetical protein
MRLINLAECESRAREIADGSTLDYYDGGSNNEITLRENVLPSAGSRFIPGLSGRRRAGHTYDDPRLAGVDAGDGGPGGFAGAIVRGHFGRVPRGYSAAPACLGSRRGSRSTGSSRWSALSPARRCCRGRRGRSRRGPAARSQVLRAGRQVRARRALRSPRIRDGDRGRSGSAADAAAPVRNVVRERRRRPRPLGTGKPSKATTPRGASARASAPASTAGELQRR